MTPHSSVSSMHKLRASPKDTSDRVSQASESPEMDSPHGNGLEITRTNASEGHEEAASRFFQGNRSDTRATISTEKSAIRHAFADEAGSLKQGHAAEGRSSNGISSIWQVPNEMEVIEPIVSRSEVDPSLYQPMPYRNRQDPIVHYLSIHNRPMQIRRKISVKDLFSSPIHKLWESKFDTFNSLQSEVANTLAHSNDSLVVSAPTGAGKTALFEIAMARLFANDLQDQNSRPGGAQEQVTNRRKILYVAPSKALCEERYEDWSRRLTAMGIGIQCAMITGDAEPGDSFRELAAANVILATPEKWDSLTRRWTENAFLFGSVKLLMIDEVHLLGDGSRGCCLESMVCRMKTIQRAVRAASASYSEHDTSR